MLIDPNPALCEKGDFAGIAALMRVTISLRGGCLLQAMYLH